ncbi:hypothetical protein G6F31_018962 [Rhizopus arrhizus]|nr:hypothetical protein G6F31_018962 [Rhizopus arrhizus]
MSSRILRRDPSPSATTDTTAAMPMMMPSMVKDVRSRCAFMDSSAMRSASPQRSRYDCQAGRLGNSGGGSRSASRRGASGLRLSATISPSLISMMRCAWRATFISCVTMMMVWPAAFSASRMRSTSWPVCVSSAPVGSSARMMSPPFISARAMLTRCCWPPDN